MSNAEQVRFRDVVRGQTYVVLVPHRLSPRRYPDRARPGTPAWTWGSLTGARFRLTVTSLHPLAAPPMVEGMRITERARTVLVLTEGQVADLGLEPGDYRLFGTLLDADDHLVYLPDFESLRVPARWLHAVDDPALRAPTHRDVDRYPYF